MQIPSIDSVPSREHAHSLAVEWQDWQSKQNLSWFDVMQWGDFFTEVGQKFDLLNEFKENGIC